MNDPYAHYGTTTNVVCHKIRYLLNLVGVVLKDIIIYKKLRR